MNLFFRLLSSRTAMQVRFVIRLKSVHRLSRLFSEGFTLFIGVLCCKITSTLSPHSLTQSSSFLVEHKSSSSACHLTLFRLPPRELSNSAILVHLQVCWGLPLLRLPCGFNSTALLAMYPSGLFSMWPIQPKSFVFRTIREHSPHVNASMRV